MAEHRLAFKHFLGHISSYLAYGLNYLDDLISTRPGSSLIYRSAAKEKTASVSTTSGRLLGVSGINTSTAVYIFIYDRATAASGGSTPDRRIYAGSNGFHDDFKQAFEFVNGLQIAVSTDPVTLTAPGTNDILLDVEYDED